MRVRRAVDLSLAVDPDTQVYPGDPVVRFETAATIGADGFNLLRLHIGSQSGTNCDAPYHFDPAGARIDEVDPALFAGPAVLIDVRGLAPRHPVGPDLVSPYLPSLGPGIIAVLWTGWPRFYGTPAYFDHPYLTAAACEAILATGVRTVCLDAINIDETPDASHPGVEFPVHRLIAAAGGIIVENLTGLVRIDFADPFLAVFPLRLTGADGSPTRAVALDLETI
jgi:kynurenine formamidase